MDFRQESRPAPLARREPRRRPHLDHAAGPACGSTAVCCAIEGYTLKSAGDDRDRILWTGPKGSGRNKLVARISYDEGRTFPNERLIAAEPAAYSDLAVLKDKQRGRALGTGRLPLYRVYSPQPGFLRAEIACNGKRHTRRPPPRA